MPLDNTPAILTSDSLAVARETDLQICFNMEVVNALTAALTRIERKAREYDDVYLLSDGYDLESIKTLLRDMIPLMDDRPRRERMARWCAERVARGDS